MPAAAQGGGVFPLPVVQVPGPCSSSSRRVRQRARRAAAETELANSALRALNSMYCSLSSTHMLTSNPTHPSSCTLRAVELVQSSCRRFVRRLGASDGAALCETTPFSSQDTGGPFAAAYAFSTDARPLSADSVSLPSAPGSVDLLDILPPDIARRYAEPSADLFRPPSEVKPAPAACLVKSGDDYVRILRRMLALGMVCFTLEPKVVNGLFGTPKSDGSLRLVFDGRRANATFTDAPSVELPGPDLLAKLECEADGDIFVAKADLDSYYHRIRLPVWMRPYFALPAVPAGLVGLGSEFGECTLVYPCCTTLPMGWSHSVYVAQSAHLHLLDTMKGGFDAADRLTRSSDFRLDRVRHLVYIDDLCLVGPARFKSEMGELLDRYVARMADHSLPTKPSKVVRPSADGVECIGVEVHGRHRTAGVLPSKLAALVHRTRALLRRGRCTGVDMARLVGHWTWAFLARRCAFSIFRAVYRFIETATHKRFDVWPSVARELRLAVDLAPLLFSSLASIWFPKVLASDASTSGQGVVAAPADPTRLAHMALATPPTGRDVDRTLHPDLKSARWSTLVASRWRRPEHINALECRALTTAVRWAISHPTAVSSRVLVWVDSLSVVFAARKGRSSAPWLSPRLRTLAAWQLAFGIRLYCNWIPTEVNPADVPSRRFEFDSTLGFPGEGPAGPNFLAAAAHQPSTRAKYLAAVQKFVLWCLQHGEDAATVVDLDHLLSSWFCDVYLSSGGACRSTAEAALNGIGMLVPAWRRRFAVSALSLRGWRNLMPPVPYPPLTWDVTVVIGARLVATGHWELGVGCLLAFECYLRVGELAGLRRKDVAGADDARLGSGFRRVALRLKHTKTGKNQWVEVRSPTVRRLLRLWLERAPHDPKARLLPVSAPSFRSHFKSACRFLGLSPDYVPHSLRHGGATHDHLVRRLPLEDILRHGRWASTKSARHYVQAGRSLLMSRSVPPNVVNAARALVPNVLRAFSLPQ